MFNTEHMIRLSAKGTSLYRFSGAMGILLTTAFLIFLLAVESYIILLCLSPLFLMLGLHYYRLCNLKKLYYNETYLYDWKGRIITPLTGILNVERADFTHIYRIVYEGKEDILSIYFHAPIGLQDNILKVKEALEVSRLKVCIRQAKRETQSTYSPETNKV